MAAVSTTTGAAGSVASFTGLASGLDTASIVKGLVALEHLPIDRLASTKTDLTTVSTKFTAFKDLLSKLNDSATDLSSRSSLLSSAATSSDDQHVGVSATAGSMVGSFEVSVTSLASAQRNQSEAFDDKSAPGLASGDLTIQVGTGTAISISVDGDSSLDAIAGDINRAGAGVTAAVLFSGGQYRLQVSGNTTGAANAVTFGGSAADSLGFDAHQMREATDAQFELDGLPMTSASNVVTDALPGITLTLKGPTATDVPATLDITRDNAAIKTKLQGFVDAYNAIAKQINTEFAYTGTAQIHGSLSGDSGLRSIQSKLRDLVGTQIQVPGSSGVTSLASIGISTQEDGTLKIDDTALSNALANSPEAVSQLLTDEPGVSTGVFGTFAKTLNDMISGDGSVITERINSIADRVKSLDDQMARMELNITAYQDRLNAQFSAMETTMSTLQNQGSQITAMMASLSSTR